MISTKLLPKTEQVFLDQKDMVYYLVDGRAYLSIGEVDQGRLMDKKKFLFSVEKGSILLPFPDEKLMLVADLLPNSVIVKWSWDEFLQLIQHENKIMEAFEIWLSNLSECMSFKMLPKKMTVLENQPDYYIIEEESIYAPKRLLWVSPFVKAVLYWNHFELQPKEFAPLSTTGWINAETGNKLTVIPTEKFVYFPEFKGSVDRYLKFMAQAFRKKQERSRFQEQKMLPKEMEAEKNRLKRFLHYFYVVNDYAKRKESIKRFLLRK